MSSEENCFALALETLALKKSSNNEVFEHIKKYLDRALKEKEFRTMNEMANFKSKDGRKYEQLDTSIPKFRKKYTNLKTEWRKLTERAKTGSGLAPEKEPKWYQRLNVIFSETNEELQLAAESGDLSFTQEFNIDENDSADEVGDNLSDNEEPDIINRRINELNSDESDEEESTSSQISAPQKGKINKVVAAPHKKRKTVRSQQQALSHGAQSIEQIASSQMKKHRMTIEADLKRDEMFLQYKREEAERNREHEIKLAEIYARAMVRPEPSVHNQWVAPVNAVLSPA